MSAEQLVETFGCLLSKLDFVSENAAKYKELKRKYRSIIASDNHKKKSDAAEIIRASIDKVYNLHREDIMSKDFGFLTEAKTDDNDKPIVGENTLIIDGYDIGTLYLSALDAGDDDHLKLVNNELLYLFYQIAPESDQKQIDSKYKKAPVKAPSNTSSGTFPNPLSAAQNVQPNLAKQMEKMLQKNSTKLKKAERDPSVIPEVLADFFQHNSKDMAGMLTGMLGSMGIDPSQMDTRK